jgi:hypothetical protein
MQDQLSLQFLVEAPASDEEAEEYGKEVLSMLNKDNKEIENEWKQNEGV